MQQALSAASSSPLCHPRIQALAASKIREVANVAMGDPGVLAFWFGEPDQVTPEPIRATWKDEPELIPIAIEELLRAYSPVTMARIATADTEVHGRTVHAGDRVLLTFPAANRDPDHFDRPDEVILDRAHNRHVAFGVGIHRCAGSNLARMEMKVAIQEWLAALPEFELDPDGELAFAGGQVRGPRVLPVVY